MKGAAPDALARRPADCLAETGHPAPAWPTPAFVAAVQDRMRRLLGGWRAFPRGEALSLEW